MFLRIIIRKVFNVFSKIIKKILFLIIENKKNGICQKRIHIIRTDTIGDFVLFSAILPYFKKLYPEHKIILIGDAVWQELAEWIQKYRILGETKNNYFDKCIFINGKSYNRNFFYYYKMLKKIRLSSPEIVIQPVFSRTQKIDEIAFISKEAQKIGYNGNSDNIKKHQKQVSNKKYDRLISNPNSVFEIDRNKHFLNELASHKILNLGAPKWILDEHLLFEARIFLKSFGVNLSKRILIICPSAGYRIKHWPIENFVLLMLKLFQYESSLQFVLIGGPRDKEICFQIEKNKQMNNFPIYNLCGKTKLSELAKILAVADLYIGNDTGAMHMSAAVGISTIGIMGGGHGNRFIPAPSWNKNSKNIAIFHKMDCFNCNWKCKYKIREQEAAPCVQKIKVDEVYNQAIKFLN